MRIFKIFLVMASWALLTFAASAQEVDLKQSNFNWKGTKVTGEHVGKVSLKSATVKLEGEKVVGGEFVIDMNSVTVTDLEGEWADKFLGHIKSGDFFDVAKYPEAKLTLTSVKGNDYTGNMTIKGKTHPVTFKATQSGKSYSGVLTFDRTKFDMVYNSGSFFKDIGDKLVHDQVTVNFTLVLK